MTAIKPYGARMWELVDLKDDDYPEHLTKWMPSVMLRDCMQAEIDELRERVKFLETLVEPPNAK